MKVKASWDALAIVMSFVRAIHCTILPLLLMALPLFGINIIHNNSFEPGMLGAFAIAPLALFNGFRRYHHRVLTFLIFFGAFHCCVNYRNY
ncbi:MAG TPA: MerC family mercury resistance protein [Chitinophagaceae bacterium]|nr:MerC family mercury resistance protein [Chitinophagaceae bacterium]